jgi:hypothetical protein
MVEIKMSVNNAGRRKLGNWFTNLPEKSKRPPKVIREVTYGMTVHEMDLELRREGGDLGHLFMLVVFGDLVGLPLLPPYYSMRLLPYIIPSLETWKRSLLKERDLADFASIDISLSRNSRVKRRC